MKKYILFTLIATVSFCCNAQKIAESKIDTFTGERVIYTYWGMFNFGLKPVIGKQFLMRLGFESNIKFMQINWVSSNVILIEEGAEVLFKLENGDIKSLTNSRNSTSSLQGETFQNYLHLIGDLDFLEKQIKTMRIYTIDGYSDFDIKKKEGERIVKMYTIFDSEIKK